MTNIGVTTKKTRVNLKALKGKIMIRGLAVIDKRTSAARHLVTWRDELIASLGGAENISPQRAALVELAVRARAIVDHVDAFVLEMPTLIDVRKKKLRPLVEQRARLADHLAKLLEQIGLDRVEKRVPSLQEVIAEMDKEAEDAEHHPSDVEP
jgi:hypothetical protein